MTGFHTEFLYRRSALLGLCCLVFIVPILLAVKDGITPCVVTKVIPSHLSLPKVESDRFESQDTGTYYYVVMNSKIYDNTKNLRRFGAVEFNKCSTNLNVYQDYYCVNYNYPTIPILIARTYFDAMLIFSTHITAISFLVILSVIFFLYN